MSQHWYLPDSTTDRELENLITSSEKFLPNMDLLRWLGLDPAAPVRILDFGAGMLRNTWGLRSLSTQWHLTAYDSQLMLQRGAKHYDLHDVTLVSDWETLVRKKFDLVFCSLVLQHIEKPHLEELVSDFTRMTDALAVVGRRALDNFQDDVWSVVLKHWAPVRMMRGGGCKADDATPIPLDLNLLLSGEGHEHYAVMLAQK